jgi:hypothetical protein
MPSFQVAEEKLLIVVNKLAADAKHVCLEGVSSTDLEIAKEIAQHVKSNRSPFC